MPRFNFTSKVLRITPAFTFIPLISPLTLSNYYFIKTFLGSAYFYFYTSQILVQINLSQTRTTVTKILKLFKIKGNVINKTTEPISFFILYKAQNYFVGMEISYTCKNYTKFLTVESFITFLIFIFLNHLYLYRTCIAYIQDLINYNRYRNTNLNKFRKKRKKERKKSP